MIEAWLLGSFALGTAVGGYMYRGSIRSAVGGAVLKELEKGQVIEIREGEDGDADRRNGRRKEALQRGRAGE